MLFDGFDPRVHAARRERVMRAAGGTAALVPAGAWVARNYPANTHPFRTSSHFLYLVGAALPDAMALLEGDRCTIFAPVPAVDDALWHGETLSPRELGEALGCAVRPLDALGDALAGRPVATVAAPDAATRARQAALLGREVAPASFDDADIPFVDALVDARLVHDDAAIAGLRRAAEATVAAHRAGRRACRTGASESAVQAAMEAEFTARGGTTSYASIVTVRGEVLHNHEHHRTLRDGDLLLADVGAETADGWAGDVTRTWPVRGTFSTTQRALYDLVLAANEAAIAAVAPGVRYRDVHLRASHVLAAGLVELGILRGDPAEIVADGVHALLFPHGVGHLLGLDVHDMEDLGDRAGYAPGRTRSAQFGLGYLRLDRDLRAGMCVTIEPGLYRVPAILADERLAAVATDRLDRTRLAQFADVRGIRIEDDVLVTATGAEVLTRDIPKRASEVEA